MTTPRLARRPFLAGLSALAAAPAAAQLQIDIVQGVREPLSVALPRLAAQPGADELAALAREVAVADLEGSGLFRVIPEAAYLSAPASADAPPAFENWTVINAAVLGAGDARLDPDGRARVRFRTWDVPGRAAMGETFEVVVSAADARRAGHKIADAVHRAAIGEPGYFDSRIAYVAETGPRTARRKRIAIMDQDGANLRYLTEPETLVVTPRFAPNGREIAYLSWAGGRPRVWLLDIASGAREPLAAVRGMSFAPRFAPDGGRLLMTLSEAGDSSVYEMALSGRGLRRLTGGPGIETGGSFSPQGDRIVYESDQGGSQQLYVMPASGGRGRRISFGAGRYGTPVWSPRGDQIAFTKQQAGRFHVGVMRPDGSAERLLTASFLDEAPSWSPNGRVILFFRETAGPNGAPALWRVDADGRNLRPLRTATAASDPDWSPLLP